MQRDTDYLLEQVSTSHEDLRSLKALLMFNRDFGCLD